MPTDPVPPGPDSFRPGEPRTEPDDQFVLRPTARPLPGAPKTSPASAPPREKKASGPLAPADKPAMKDGFREVVETVVFVVVLVLLLKTFLAEAFVIPTGSMATTLLGYHRNVPCEKCGYSFPVNCSQEVEPQGGKRNGVEITGGVCPNCQWVNDIERGRRR